MADFNTDLLFEDMPDDGESLSRLTNAGVCRTSDAFDIDIKDPEKGSPFYRSAIVAKTIRSALRYNVRKGRDVLEYMLSRYDEVGAENAQQERRMAFYDWRLVMRYLNAEGRKAFFPAGKTIEIIHGYPYRVTVHAAFEEGKDRVELVRFKRRKPEFTENATGDTFARDMQLYAMILYGRALGYKNVTASIYYLRKTTDRNDWYSCDQSFFGDGGNVVSLSDIVEDGKPSLLDGQMMKHFTRLEEGLTKEEETDKDCEYCPKWELCKGYTLPPIIKEPETDADVNTPAVKVTLSEEQQEIVDFQEGIAVVNACAGTGKTFTVKERDAALVENGAKPEEIMNLTYTNAAADEMRDRIRKTGINADRMTICTFHSFLYSIVKDNYAELGFSKKPALIDDVEKYGIIRRFLNENPILEWDGNAYLNFNSVDRKSPGAVGITADIFKSIKQMDIPADQVTVRDVRGSLQTGWQLSDSVLAKIIAMYPLFTQQMLDDGLVDFDDMCLMAFRILRDHPDYLETHYGFKHVVIDEFQDTSMMYIEFLQMLRKTPKFQSLLAVGDDMQGATCSATSL